MPGTGKSITDDGFEDQPVRSWREAVAGAELGLDVFHFEIGDRVQLLALLRQRQEVTDLAVIGIIFDPDKSIAAAFPVTFAD